VKEDSLRLLPLIGLFIIVCLFIAFRNPRAIIVSLSTLVIGLVWSYGTMGFMGIALNTLNMTIVPLVMGIGIDYSIHMINEFVEHKSEGHDNIEAFRLAGTRSGVAMLIATATTIGGLAVLIFSPSLLIAELGIVATVALTVIYLLAITFIPAALTLIGSSKMGASFRRSGLMPALARGITKARWAVVALLVIISLVSYPIADGIGKEAFGDPGRNYLPSDPIRKEHEKGLAWFYEAPNSDEKANILTFSGKSILTPEAMQYYREVEKNLKQETRIIPDTLRTLPFFIETWLTVKGGPTGAAGSVVRQEVLGIPLPVPLPDPVHQQVDTFPTTEEGLKAEVNAMFASPMKELASIIINHPTNDMAAMTFSVRAASYDEAAEVWGQVWTAVGKANATFGGHPPGDMTVAFVGNTATNYLFIAEELPWLAYMNIVDNIMLVLLVGLMTRSFRTTFVTLLLSTLTSLWWLALLPSFGIGLAITLTLPFAFIIAIGTDYGIHFMWNIQQTGNAREVFASTGKAVLFSAITTTGAFAFFIAVQNVAVSRTMFATMLAFIVIFLVTLLTIPVFFKVGPRVVKTMPKH
jgi:predicted RND superfamily exporter protein